MKKALLLTVLLMGALLPTAHAAGAEPRPWAPYNAVSEVVDVVLARDGTTIAAALGSSLATASSPQPGVPSPSAPAPCNSASGGLPVSPDVGACADLAVLDVDYGFARNGTFLSPNPLGRSHVAVSRDGLSIASLGIDGATVAQRTLHLRYMRLVAGTNWSTATPYERDITLPVAATAAGLAISDDGRRIAVLTGEGTDYVVRGYAFGAALDSAFEIRAPGSPRALAAAGDMSRVLVAGQFPVGNFTYGGAFLLPFAQGEPLSSYFDASANGTDVRSAAMSRDGLTSALGGADGRVHVFRGGSLSTVASASLGTGGIGNITLSEDGARLAATNAQTLFLFDATPSTLAPLWNATLGGQNVTGLAMNRTGALLLASTSGTGGGIFAFDEAEPTVLWSLPGDSRGVAINSDGTRIAYAQRATIGAAKLPRSLTMDLAGGGKVAPQRTIALPGSATYEVQLRNEGSVTERVVFEEGAPEIVVSTTPPVTLVRPGAILRVNVTVSVADPLPGPRVFNVSARALGSGIVDNVTLSLAPQPTLDVKLLLNETDILALPGVTSTILLTIVNNGTSDANVAIAAQQTTSAGPAWDLQVSEQTLTALRGTRASVKVLMTPPADVANGTSSTVKFTLQGQDIFDTSQVTFRVNPDLKVEVNATGVTKFIEPGHSAAYSVTVTNTGSLPRDFEVFYTITESSGRSWGVTMQTDTIELQPLQKRVFPVTIVAPGDVQPQDRVSVQVSARSIPEQVNETVVMDNVTLFGVAVELKIPTPSTPTNDVPFAAPVAVIALTLFVAALRRRSQ